MVEAKKEPCDNCGGMGIIQDFKGFPGRFANSKQQQVAKYTGHCMVCGKRPVWEPA